jgi:hypothetical protein
MRIYGMAIEQVIILGVPFVFQACCLQHLTVESLVRQMNILGFSYLDGELNVMKSIGKGKMIPLHAMEAHGGGGGGEKRYSSYSYLTSALDGG